MWTTLQLGMKEIDTRTCSSGGTKTEENPGKMLIRGDFKLAARSFAVDSHQEGQRYSYIPRGGRFRQRPLNAQLEADLEWRSQRYQKNRWFAGVIFFIFGNLVGKPTGIGGIQQIGTNHTKKNDTVKIAGKSQGYRLFGAM